MKPPPLYISKTNFVTGHQCLKLLWIKLRDGDKLPPHSEHTKHLFNQGHKIGDLAKSLFPDGIEVAEGEFRYDKVIAETRALLPERLPLFETGLAYDGGYARADILVPDEDDAWHIIEVKSTGGVKPSHVIDAAFQKYLYQGAGLKISKCSLMHVNSKYLRNGDINIEELLHCEDITAKANQWLPSIPELLSKQKEILHQEKSPAQKIGPHCNSPYECKLKYLCWDFLPKRPVTTLYKDSKKLGWDLLDQGIESIADIPESVTLSAKQQIQQSTITSEKAHVDQAAIQNFLDTLEWPLAYFDLESFMAAIPPYDGSTPFQQIPFQFSLHTQASPDAVVEHREFLADDLSDPRPAFMEAAKTSLPATGSIVVYSAPFERRILKECATLLPEYQSWFKDILPRFVDLLDPFNKFAYYNPEQHGRTSLKAVLPALTGTSYEGLEIAEGAAASSAFLRMVDEATSPSDSAAIRGHLLEYCKLDTKAMVDLIDALKSLTFPQP